MKTLVPTTKIRQWRFRQDPTCAGQREVTRKLQTPGRMLSDERKSELRKQYRDGVAIRELARRFGIARSSVVHICTVQCGLPPRNERRLTDEQARRAKQAHDGGVSRAQLAKRYGCDSQTLGRRWKKLGIS